MSVIRERVALYHVGSVSVPDRVALLVSCDRIVPGWIRNCAGWLAIVFRFADEIGGTGIAGNYCFG
jgi:hypothetical protein